MITLKCIQSGYKQTGIFVAKTDDHYVLEINGITQMFKVCEWEESRDEEIDA